MEFELESSQEAKWRRFRLDLKNLYQNSIFQQFENLKFEDFFLDLIMLGPIADSRRERISNIVCVNSASHVSKMVLL